jgi:hypothetical protein
MFCDYSQSDESDSSSPFDYEVVLCQVKAPKLTYKPRNKIIDEEMDQSDEGSENIINYI